MPIDHRPFLELSPEMACVLDIEGRVLDLNPAWTATLGIPIDELKGRSFLDLVHSRDRDAMATWLQRLAAGKHVTEAEHRFMHEDGGFRWLSWSAAPRLNESLIYATVRQIGDGTVSLRHLKAVIDGTTDFVGLADLDGHVSFMNAAAMAMVGRAGQSYLGLKISDVRTPKGSEQSANVIRPTALRDGIWSGETELAGPDGKPLTIWQVFFLIRDEEGAPRAFGSIGRDVSERNRRDLELRRFKAIADTTSDFVAIATIPGELLYINDAGLRLLGRTGEDVRALRIRDLITEASAARYEPEMRASLSAGGTWSGEPDLRHKNGHSVPSSCVVMVLRDQDGEPAELAIVSRDLTSHRRVDALQSELRAMSTPILEVGNGVLALPVIGSVDSQRASEMTESLLNAIVRARCRVAILDLTGVDAIDTSTLGHLFKMISAASLLGSMCVISGISARVAQTISTLGADLSAVRAFRTLEDALAFAQRA